MEGQNGEVFVFEWKHFSVNTAFVSSPGGGKAIGWVNQMSGLEPIAHSPLVRPTLVGLRRTLAKPKVEKEPVTVNMLAALVQSLGTPLKLNKLRLAGSCLLALADFLHYEKMAKLRCCDTTISDTSMSVHILSSKTDQYHHRDTVLGACTNSPTCPVAMMERCFSQAGL